METEKPNALFYGDRCDSDLTSLSTGFDIRAEAPRIYVACCRDNFNRTITVLCHPLHEDEPTQPRKVEILCGRGRDLIQPLRARGYTVLDGEA
jgi:hypothetical protein